MNELEKLLEGVEVKWKSLGDVVQVEKGKQLNKDLLSEEGEYPAYNGGINLSGYTNLYNYDKNNTIISQGGASAGFVNYVSTKFYANAHCYVVLPNYELVENRYIYHFLKLSQNSLMFRKHGAGIPALKKSQIIDLQIPIPPIAVQKEIVRILDTFTGLTAELKTELIARKKQFTHYRDQLLSFEGQDVERQPLGDIGKIIRGNGLQKKNFRNEGFPAIHYGQLFTRYGLSAKGTFTYVEEDLAKKLRKAETNDLLIATTSENDDDVLKPLAWLGDEASISGDMMMFKHKQNVKFLAYYFQTSTFQKQKRKYISGAKVRRVSSSNLAKMIVPVPSIEEQNRIVAILDKFDTLTTSDIEGLPAEIKLRQKQYEYYRDLLLTFPNPKD